MKKKKFDKNTKFSDYGSMTRNIEMQHQGLIDVVKGHKTINFDSNELVKIEENGIVKYVPAHTLKKSGNIASKQKQNKEKTTKLSKEITTPTNTVKKSVSNDKQIASIKNEKSKTVEQSKSDSIYTQFHGLSEEEIIEKITELEGNHKENASLRTMQCSCGHLAVFPQKRPSKKPKEFIVKCDKCKKEIGLIKTHPDGVDVQIYE